MKKIDLSIVNDDFLQSYLNSIDLTSIRDSLELLEVSFLNELEEIIIADVNKIEEYKENITFDSIEQKKEIKKAFNYAWHRQQDNFMEHFKKLNIKSCPFCNNNYIYFYNDENPRKTIATLEHFYPKSKYPHLSLSFYNLIPSCYICNSKFKGNEEHEGKIIHPYRDDFSENSEFYIKPRSFENELEFDIDLKTYDDKSKMSVDRFKLNEIYKEHNDIAKEIWHKSQYYNDSRIEELYNEFYKDMGYTKEDVKNMIFCNYLKKDDINKRNHSKLTQDILKQFRMIENNA